MNKFIFTLLTIFLVASCSKDNSDDVSKNCDPVWYVDTIDLTTNSAKLYWSYSTDNPNISFVVEYGLEGFSIGSGTVVNTQERDNSITISNLSAEKTYSFYVKAKCDTNNFSENVGPIKFTTLVCAPIGITRVDNISETSALISWVLIYDLVEIEYGLEGFQVGSGTTSQILNSNSYTLENLSPLTTYDVYTRNICGNDFSKYSTVKTFTTLEICKTPKNLQLISVGRYSVRIQWDRVGESSWQVEYGSVGFKLGTGKILNTSFSDPLIEDGINPNTTYEFYVRANCGSKGYSNYAGPLVVSTKK